jgi:acyl-CoA thioesterase FadM
VAPVRLGRTSITFAVTGRQDGRDCFRGRFTCVFTRHGELASAPPPDAVRALVERHLAPDPAG